MVIASQLRPGAAIKYQGQPYKVLAADYRPGQGQMSGATHVRLENLNTHTTWEHAIRADLKLEEIPLEKRTLEFLYRDGGQCCFMHSENFEQVELSDEMAGPRVSFLEAGMRIPVEFLDGVPIGVLFPDVLEVRIADTAPPMHQQQDTNFKTARLENGIEVLVPQFVKTGDSIRLGLEHMRYMDRVKA